MIRVGIVANSAGAADEIADTLGFEERLEVVDVRIGSRLVRVSEQQACDVVLAVGLTSLATPVDTPPVVVITDGPVKTFLGLPSIHAVLPMTARGDEIVAALLAAASGLFALTAEQASAVERSPKPEERFETGQEKLTARELEVLRMLADGLANKEIASALGVSDHTAKFHVSQILAKLNAASRTEAVTAGIRSGLLAI